MPLLLKVCHCVPVSLSAFWSRKVILIRKNIPESAGFISATTLTVTFNSAVSYLQTKIDFDESKGKSNHKKTVAKWNPDFCLYAIQINMPEDLDINVHFMSCRQLGLYSGPKYFCVNIGYWF